MFYDFYSVAHLDELLDGPLSRLPDSAPIIEGLACGDWPECFQPAKYAHLAYWSGDQRITAEQARIHAEKTGDASNATRRALVIVQDAAPVGDPDGPVFPIATLGDLRKLIAGLKELGLYLADVAPFRIDPNATPDPESGDPAGPNHPDRYTFTSDVQVAWWDGKVAWDEEGEGRQECVVLW
ncbi:hypothetical protein [Nonomuraea salmonea]|uniref:Uncharacterized protein n=1 Tax=Nonomuraea salmonea TaxID=46181 RepID=A0ABV5P2N4_9ACTN